MVWESWQLQVCVKFILLLCMRHGAALIQDLLTAGSPNNQPGMFWKVSALSDQFLVCVTDNLASQVHFCHC